MLDQSLLQQPGSSRASMPNRHLEESEEQIATEFSASTKRVRALILGQNGLEENGMNRRKIRGPNRRKTH